MCALSVWLCILATIFFIDSVNSGNIEAESRNNKEVTCNVAVLNTGVAESETEVAPNPAVDGYNSRHLRVIYRWPDKEFCHFRFKVEAVTTVEVAGNHRTSRHFLKVILDHRLLDILELSDEDSFFTDDVKLGRFIMNQTVWGCNRFRLEYKMVGGSCRARIYRRVKIFTIETEGEQNVIIEDWRWEGSDDECDNHVVTML